MHFEVEFYVSAAGSKPVEEFLDALERTDPNDARAVIAGIAKLRDRRNHHEPLSKSLGGGIYELRHVGKLNTRVLWFYRKARRIVLLHGVRNKSQKIDKSDLKTALDRAADWKARYPE